jgi:hypothetical protein
MRKTIGKLERRMNNEDKDLESKANIMMVQEDEAYEEMDTHVMLSKPKRNGTGQRFILGSEC